MLDSSRVVEYKKTMYITLTHTVKKRGYKRGSGLRPRHRGSSISEGIVMRQSAASSTLSAAATHFWQ